MSAILNILVATQSFQVLSGFTIRAEHLGPATPQITFNTDGTCTTSDSTNQPWGTPATSGVGAQYWVNMQLGTGNGVAGGAARSTWIQLSSAVSYSIGSAIFPSIKTRTGTYSIATDSGGVTIVGGGNFSLVDDNT